MAEEYQWKNEQLKNLAANGPQFKYNPGLLDWFGNWFSDLTGVNVRTGEDKAQEEYENYEQMRLDQLRQLDQENYYNSAPEQVERMEMAGQNPNLTGGITPGEAGEYDNQANQGPTQDVGPDIETITKAVASCNQVIGFLATGLSSILTTTSQLNGIMGQNADLRSKIDAEVARLIEGHWDYSDRNGMQFRTPYFNRYAEIGENEGEEDIAPLTLIETSWDEFNNNPEVQERWQTTKERRLAYKSYLNQLSNLETINKGKGSLINERNTNLGLGEVLGDTVSASVTAAQQWYEEVKPHLRAIEKIEANLMHDYNATLNRLSGGKMHAEANYHNWKYNSEYYKILNPEQIANTANTEAQERQQYLDEFNSAQAGINDTLMLTKTNENMAIEFELQRQVNSMIMTELNAISRENDPVLRMIRLQWIQYLTQAKRGTMNLVGSGGQLLQMGIGAVNSIPGLFASGDLR